MRKRGSQYRQTVRPPSVRQFLLLLAAVLLFSLNTPSALETRYIQGITPHTEYGQGGSRDRSIINMIWIMSKSESTGHSKLKGKSRLYPNFMLNQVEPDRG